MWGHQEFSWYQRLGWDSHQNIHAWANAPISCHQSYELAISRTKRGEVEITIVSHILQVSPVLSVPLPQKCKCWCPHTPGPPSSNFSTLVQHRCSGGILRTAQSFLVTDPRVVSAICCWAGSRQSALCDTFSVPLLFEVYSSRTVLVHPSHSAHMTIQRGVPLQEWCEKVSFGGGLVSGLSTGSSWGMKGCHQWPSISLIIIPPPTGSSLSPSPCRHWI